MNISFDHRARMFASPKIDLERTDEQRFLYREGGCKNRRKEDFCRKNSEEQRQRKKRDPIFDFFFRICDRSVGSFVKYEDVVRLYFTASAILHNASLGNSNFFFSTIFPSRILPWLRY